ncbi:hypothetical protein [Patulibacter sp. SYSU D01012]|uniref:hypothetical protein n=1 Tax=Patulibacter sp. SYSU D01012 TaxID=2817381 RepID=UPI001B30CA25|nr:hypothetical protein [Patulibacter sp. SYSU D01012]
MDQNTYSFPKVTPADPQELRETLRANRRETTADRDAARRRDDARRTGDDAQRHH